MQTTQQHPVLTRNSFLSRYVFATFQGNVVDGFDFSMDDQLNSQYKTIPTFLTLFIFGFVYQLILVWDALRMKNTIQVIGICLSNLAFLVYTSLQIDQIGSALDFMVLKNVMKAHPPTEPSVWDQARPFLVAIPAILAVTTIVMAFLAWKLYKEFAWDILKQIGADYRMKKRFLHYQVHSNPTTSTCRPLTCEE